MEAGEERKIGFLARHRCRPSLDALRNADYLGAVEIESILHKGLKRFFETGNAKGFVGDVERIRKMLAFITAAASIEELATPPNYGLHPLAGERTGTWSMTVTRNWRMTFRLTAANALADMDLEDCHGA